MKTNIPELPKGISPKDVFIKIVSKGIDDEGEAYQNGIYVDCDGNNILDMPKTDEDRVTELEQKLEELRALLKTQQEQMVKPVAPVAKVETKP